MPRNSSGNFILPVGNPVSPNTVIESQWANVTMDDLAQGLTDSLDRQGRGGMLAPFRLADGTLTAPGLAFLAEPSMGIRRAGTKHMEAVMSGITRQRWLDTRVEFPQEIRAQASAVITGTVTGTAVTQTEVDSTTGRLLKVGDFGLGSSRDLGGVTLTTLGGTQFGAHYQGGAPPDAPVASQGALVHIGRLGGTLAGQWWVSTDTPPRAFVRAAADVAGVQVWRNWVEIITAANLPSSITGNAATATALQTARTINGTSFNGTADITTSNWGTARTINGSSVNGSANVTTANWGTARTLTINGVGQSVNGSANVAWTVTAVPPTAYNTVGTYALLMTTQNTTPIVNGSTYAGSGLFPMGHAHASAIAGDAVATISTGRGPTAVSGTWRAMGRLNSSSNWHKGTLFVRIS